MKRVLLSLLLLMGGADWLSAATRADVNVLEATENIRYLSQRITRNYLYLYANPQKRYIEEEIRKDLGQMVEGIRVIATTTNDEDTRNILEFLTYSKDQIEELIHSRPDKEKAALMLDYSETLLEGANSIAKTYSYAFTEGEKMLMKSKSIAYLMERSAKYYLALGVGLGSSVNKQQMQEALRELGTTIGILEGYAYPRTMRKSQERLRSFWQVTRGLFTKERSLFVSNIIVLSADEMEKIGQTFVLFHRKHH